MKTIAVFVGSLRRDSQTRRLTGAIERLGGSRFRFRYADIGALPMYNEDLWADLPGSVGALKGLVESSDAVLFVTPEYNRSVPAVIKNAIDWGSRPYGRSSWNAKPGGLIGMSPGAIGAAVAISHLRGMLIALDVAVMGQPEAYFQLKPGTLGEDGAFADEGARGFFAGYLDKFEQWVGRTAVPAAETQPNG